MERKREQNAMILKKVWSSIKISFPLSVTFESFLSLFLNIFFFFLIDAAKEEEWGNVSNIQSRISGHFCLNVREILVKKRFQERKGIDQFRLKTMQKFKFLTQRIFLKKAFFLQLQKYLKFCIRRCYVQSGSKDHVLTAHVGASDHEEQKLHRNLGSERRS